MKKLMIAGMFIAALVIVGCGGGAEELDAPQITMVVMGETTIDITWVEDTEIEGHADFQGYNVYVYTDSTPLLEHDGENLNKDNADPETGTTYTISGLDQDSVYYIQVRTVNTDDVVGDYNGSLPFVQASPRPEFERTVYVEWNDADTTSNVALNFSTGEVDRRSAISTTWGDIWIDHGIYGSDDSVWIQSAWRADSACGYRDTRLVNEGQHGFEDEWEASEPTLRVVPIVQGDLVFAKTVEGNYVKLHVDSLSLGGVANSWALLTYAYQNIVEFPYLSP